MDIEKLLEESRSKMQGKPKVSHETILDANKLNIWNAETSSKSTAKDWTNEIDISNFELDVEQLDKVIEYKNTAKKYYNKKKFLEALSVIEDAIKILPGDLELLFYQALNLFQLGNVERAEKIVSELYKLDEDKTLTALPKIYAILLLRLKKYSQAIEFIDSILGESHNDLQLMNMLAFSFERQNKLEESTGILESILILDPQNANACNSLAYIFSRKSISLDKAESLSRLALEKEARNPSYLDTMGMILKKQGKIELAKVTLKKALKIAPNNSEILKHLSELS